MASFESFAAMTGRMLVALAATAVISVPSMAQDLDMSQFNHLKEPGISAKINQKMLVVEAKGDPNIVGTKAYGLLFQIYYSMPETPKSPVPPAPRARWSVSLEKARSEWIGLYAVPVPETVTQLPPYQAQEGLKASLTMWEYGDVAEILHIGPYSREEPTIKRLVGFIKEKGYMIAGPHEEEYIRGPSMYGPGDPEKYLTIMRYQVRKQGNPS